MTGYFIRVQRDGCWQSVEIDQLTDEELDRFATDCGQAGGWKWAKALARWIRENVRQMDINDVVHARTAEEIERPGSAKG